MKLLPEFASEPPLQMNTQELAFINQSDQLDEQG